MDRGDVSPAETDANCGEGRGSRLPAIRGAVGCQPTFPERGKKRRSEVEGETHQAKKLSVSRVCLTRQCQERQ